MPAQNAMRATRSDMSRPDVSRAQATTAALQHRAHPDEQHDDRSWHDQANCLGVDPDLFFPERGASTREAKEVCRGVSCARTASSTR